MAMCMIIEIKGELVEVHGNTPVKILSEDEVKEVRYKNTTQYKSKHLSDIELLDEYLSSLYRGKTDDAAIYKTEVLRRMSGK